MTSYYQRTIAEDAPGYDAEQVEVYMRLKLQTLDHLTREAFRAEVREACACIDADPHCWPPRAQLWPDDADVTRRMTR